jgi:hypothetical protein
LDMSSTDGRGRALGQVAAEVRTRRGRVVVERGGQGGRWLEPPRDARVVGDEFARRPLLHIALRPEARRMIDLVNMMGSKRVRAASRALEP